MLSAPEEVDNVMMRLHCGLKTIDEKNYAMENWTLNYSELAMSWSSTESMFRIKACNLQSSICDSIIATNQVWVTWLWFYARSSVPAILFRSRSPSTCRRKVYIITTSMPPATRTEALSEMSNLKLRKCCSCHFVSLSIVGRSLMHQGVRISYPMKKYYFCEENVWFACSRSLNS